MELGERNYIRSKEIKFYSSSPARRHAEAERALQWKWDFQQTHTKKAAFASSLRYDPHEGSLSKAKHLDHSPRNLRFNLLESPGMILDWRLPVSDLPVSHWRTPHHKIPNPSSTDPSKLFKYERTEDREQVPTYLLGLKTTRFDGTEVKAQRRSRSNRESLLNEEEGLASSDSRNIRSPHYLASQGSKPGRNHQRKIQSSFNFQSINNIHSYLMSICIKYAARRVGQLNSNEGCACPKVVARQHHQVSRNKSQLTDAQILELSLKDKQSSMVVQQYIDRSDGFSLNVISVLLLGHLDQLLQDPFGSYVVQHLMRVHRPTLVMVIDHVSKNLLQMATNEYSSRVIQSIFDIEQDFCLRILPNLVQMFDKLINSFSGSILLTKLVSVVEDDSIYSIFVKILEQNKEYLRKAYFNRMLSTLVSCCSEHMLDQVVELTAGHIWELMNDKFGNCVLQTYYRRSHARGVQLIEESAGEHYEVFLTRRYPKIMMINLMSEDRAAKIAGSICRLLTSADTSVLAPALQKRESFSLLLLMATSSNVELITIICERIELSIDEQNITKKFDFDVELLYLNKKLLALSSN